MAGLPDTASSKELPPVATTATPVASLPALDATTPAVPKSGSSDPGNWALAEPGKAAITATTTDETRSRQQVNPAVRRLCSI